MSNAKKPRGLREALRKRQKRVTIYRVPLISFEEASELRAAIQQARMTVQAGELVEKRSADGDKASIDEALTRARAELAAAEQRLEEGFYEIRFAGLPSDEFDALVQLHPPTEQQLETSALKRDDPPTWNDETFYPALLEACAVDSELSAAEWSEELAGWEKPERVEIQQKCLEANLRSFDRALSFV